MERLTVASPAAWSDCLACAGGRALARKAAIWMRANGETVAIFAASDLLAIAYLVPDSAGRREFCLSIRTAARPHMRALCHLAHSTLTRLVEDGAVVVCHVMPGNRSGERMARLCGFEPVADEWIFEGDRHGGGKRPIRRRARRQRAQAGGEERADPEGCQ